MLVIDETDIYNSCVLHNVITAYGSAPEFNVAKINSNMAHLKCMQIIQDAKFRQNACLHKVNWH